MRNPEMSPSEIGYHESGGDMQELEGKMFDVSDIDADMKERQELVDTLNKIGEIVNEVSDQNIVEAVEEMPAEAEAWTKVEADFFAEGEKMDEAHKADIDYAEARKAAEAIEIPPSKEMSQAVKDGKLPEKNREALQRNIEVGKARLEVAKADLANMFNRFAETFAMDPDTLLQERSISKLAAAKMALKYVFRPSYRKMLRAYEAKIAEAHAIEDNLREDTMALESPDKFADEMNRRVMRAVEMSARIAGAFVAAPPGGRREIPSSASMVEATDEELATAAEEIHAAKMAEISAEAEKQSERDLESPMTTELERAWEKEGFAMDKAHAEGIDYAKEKEIAGAAKPPTRQEMESFAKRGEITPKMVKMAHDRMAEREVEIKVAKYQLADIEDKMLRKYGLNPAILLKEKTFSKMEALKTGLRSLFDGGFRKTMRHYENLTHELGRLQQENADDEMLIKDPKAFGAEMSRRTLKAMVVGAAVSGRSTVPKGTLGVGPTSTR